METIDTKFSSNTLDEMLVDLHDAQLRYALADPQEGPLASARVVGVVANIINADLTESEKHLAADVLVSLIRQAELDLREALSLRLSIMAGVPQDLILFLAHDVIDVAEPVLKASPVLTATDLLYIIQSKGAEFWRAIAQRRALNDLVINALAEKKDQETALNLLNNETIDLTPSAMKIFAELSRYSDGMAEPLLQRPELPQEIAMDLFWHVSDKLRVQITKKFKISKDKLDAALQDALQDFVDTVNKAHDARPSSLMLDLAKQYNSLNRINDAILIKTLRRGQVRFFVALFAERTGLSPQTVFDLMRQVGGQGMAVACKAISVSKENFVSLFLLARSIAHSDSPMDAGELRKAIKYYDLTSADIASQILADSK